MTQFRGGGPGKLAAAITPLAERVRAPVDFHRARNVRGRSVALDFLVHGAPVTFHLAPSQERGTWRIEVAARDEVDAPQVGRLGLEPSGPHRSLVATVPEGAKGALPETLTGPCLDLLDRLAALGPAGPARELLDALGLADPLVVVDVGANPLELPAYTRLLGLGACRVVGFEPQPEAFARLRGKDPARELYYPLAIGRPGTQHLNVFQASGFASTFEIDESSIDLINSDRWRSMTRLRETIELELTALDDVPDLPAVDLLKIDVQGGELAVFESGRRALSDALCVIPEVSFFPLYRDQPTFADVHQELAAQGFGLHKFMFQKSVHVHGSQSDLEPPRWPTKPRNQLVDGDAVYLRDLRGIADFTTDQLKKLVLLATFVFDSPDLAVRALDVLAGRGDVRADLPERYAGHTYV